MLWLALLASCRREDCEIQPIVRSLAGSGATDCGELQVDDATKGWACVAKALDAGDAFYFVTYDYDVDVGYYFAYASDGASTWEAWQNDEATKRRNSIDGRECFDPVVHDEPVFHDMKPPKRPRSRARAAWARPTRSADAATAAGPSC